jgi:haloalkane dehalogenase
LFSVATDLRLSDEKETSMKHQGQKLFTRKDVNAAFARGPMKRLSLPHGEIASWTFGAGPDVLMVHGWPLHGATFRGSIPHLAQRFTVHVIDLPGAGATTWNGPVGFVEHAETVRAVIDELSLERFALVGHNSGGLIARIAAQDDPRVAGLVVADTEVPGHHSALVGALVTAANLPMVPALISKLMAFGFVRRSNLGFGGCFRDRSLVDGEFNDLFLRPLRTSAAVRTGQFRTLLEADFSVVDRMDEIHQRLRAPVRCIWGTDDPFFPIEKARAMLPGLPSGSDFIEIPGGKVFAHEEFADLFAEYTSAFLLNRDWKRTEASVRAPQAS